MIQLTISAPSCHSTNGYLVGVKKSDIFAIVEVKAGIRDPEQYPLVEWQEFS
jgi:hypothetical protein